MSCIERVGKHSYQQTTPTDVTTSLYGEAPLIRQCSKSYYVIMPLLLSYQACSP